MRLTERAFMRRRSLLLLLLAGCAKSVPTPNAAPAAEPRATSPQSTAIFRDGTRQTIYKDPETATTATFPKPPNVMAAAVRLAFAKLEVPVTVDDAGARIGNADFYRARTFAGQRMPVFLNCGDGITGANALSYRIYMSLLTTIVADGRGGSKVAVVLVASARDVAGGASTDRVPCGPTGMLEKQMLETIRGHMPAG